MSSIFEEKRIRQQFGELMFFLQENLTKQLETPSPNLHQDSTQSLVLKTHPHIHPFLPFPPIYTQ